jgi:hypothetical protein
MLFESRGMTDDEDSASLCRSLADELASCRGDYHGDSGVCGFTVEDLVRFDISYVEGQDFLGLLYMSLRCIGSRKSDGAYYTPTSIVDDSAGYISGLGGFEDGARIIDPCCGTGNFMAASFLKKRMSESHDAHADLASIYGIDIDPTSVMIARINMALVSKVADVETLRKNIVCANALFENPFGVEFDVVIGNPPWGCGFSADEAETLSGIYETFHKGRAESFAVFIEAGLGYLKIGGYLAYVVKDSLLNVKAHSAIRAIIMGKADITRISYWGNCFGSVLAPCITLVLKKGEAFSPIGTTVDSRDRSFIIGSERMMTPDDFSYHMDDVEYEIVSRLERTKGAIFLKGNADFAMGLVTGDNDKFISGNSEEGTVPVLKGSDIMRYRTGSSSSHIRFSPDKFQQVAPIEMYMADEKLLYRFISDRLVFAYDDGKRLSLNSCNVLIPKVEGMSMKYVMAVLNSRVADFYFRKRFMSIKVLRSHIERIPIPAPSREIHDEIVGLVDNILSDSSCDVDKMQQVIDDMICDIFGLTDEERRSVGCGL